MFTLGLMKLRNLGNPFRTSSTGKRLVIRCGSNPGEYRSGESKLPESQLPAMMSVRTQRNSGAFL
jgi:hypothetical protein